MECDADIGCVMPNYETKKDLEANTTSTEQVHLVFVTDPICSHCWALEPVWRRLKLNYQVNERYIHGGLLPGWENFGDPGNGIAKPTDVIGHWQQVAQHYQQPIDPSMWAKDPISNSYILCRAAIAVRLLAPNLESAFVRLMRERIFLYAENMAKDEALAELVTSMGLDGQAFATLLHSEQVLTIFNTEQQEMMQLGARGFPSLIFNGDNAFRLAGSQPYQNLERALVLMGEAQPKRRHLTVQQKLTSYPSWTLREACEVLQVSAEEARIELHQFGFIESQIAGGSFWHKPAL
ncbi:DsbA family protein [Pseudoalteromonas sp. BDTF-M6]|uniref:DsbA family protein n=1 Tax=Pseudoalteromonas sp. BDTF-M6 TaxID=2796132 RepID=UPI001BB09AC0|nr:DsbA family protein [Pseudoalteromonas sp. BDTF-M6]MBS3798950.1 DsbA family protein [Pseudoalteromonas sp. BDTF-M6]